MVCVLVLGATAAGARERLTRAVSTGTAAGGLPELLFSWTGSASGFRVRPRLAIQLAGDGTAAFAGPGPNPYQAKPVAWTRWTSSRAIGRGYLYENDCNPSCAGGAFFAYPGTVTASRPSDGRFGELRITVRQGKRILTFTDRLVRNGDGGIWGDGAGHVPTVPDGRTGDTGPGNPPPAAGAQVCAIPHGVEGGFTLTFDATGVSCTTGRVVVNEVDLSGEGGPCAGHNLLSSPCHASDGFRCTDPSPTTPGYTSPGDTVYCSDHRKSIQWELPG
jgi:hypothetical protein